MNKRVTKFKTKKIKKEKIEIEVIPDINFDEEYKKLIKDIENLPWDKSPRNKRQSFNELIGSINGKRINFAWYHPDNKYSFIWCFLGIIIDDGERKFNQTCDTIFNKYSNKKQFANLEDFKRAIKYIKGGD